MMRAGGLPGAEKWRFCGGTSNCQPFGDVCAIANGNGVLVNCTKVEPSGRVARSNSPAISGAARLDCQIACPGRTDQPGSERFTFGSGGPLKQPVRLASPRRLRAQKSGLLQWEKTFLSRKINSGLKKSLNIIANCFSKSDRRGRNVGKFAAKNNGGEKPVYFSSGNRYSERSFAVEIGALRLAI
jgi:hypothetical protein